MKLVYFQDPKGNFGDDLNPWLWERLLPGVLDNDDSDLIVGVGTILEPWFAKGLSTTARKIVIGSGSGMSIPPPRFGPEWTFVCVRGPLTAAYLGLPPALATTDPAMCLRDLWPQRGKAGGRVGFMPHYGSLRRWDWRRTCELAGLEFVDPCGEAVSVLEQISGLRMILTEAMHGAIVADALRVPWLPLQISPTNYVGKWHDWSASIRVPIHFNPLPYLYDPVRTHGYRELIRRGPHQMGYEMRRRSSRRQHREAVKLLERYATGYEGHLSDDRDLDRAISMFRDRLEQFRTSRI